MYVEHDTPRGDVPLTRHPVADRDDLVLAHVTHFNRLFWDSGSTPTRVVEHGIVDPDLSRALIGLNLLGQAENDWAHRPQAAVPAESQPR